MSSALGDSQNDDPARPPSGDPTPPDVRRAREAVSDESGVGLQSDPPAGENVKAMNRFPSEHGSELRRSVSEATKRIESIIDAAANAADQIRADAEAEAERYLARRRSEADRLVGERARGFAELIERLVERASGLQAESEEVLAELRAAARGFAELSAPRPEPPRPEPVRPDPLPSEPLPPQAAAAEQAPQRAMPRPTAYPGTAGEPPALSESPAAPGALPLDAPVPEEALLRATQMAVAGNARVEIERTLRVEFAIDDPSPVLDEILGPDAA